MVKFSLLKLRKRTARLQEQQDALSAEVVKTELHTGITLADLALSAQQTDKLERNKANARKAYDTASRYMGRVTPQDALDLDDLLKRLCSKLQKLGESV